MRPVARPLVVAGALVIVLVAVYLVALGTGTGRRLDNDAVFYAAQGGLRIRGFAGDVIRSIDIGTLVLFGGGMLALSLARRQLDSAVIAPLALLGATATSEILKPVLGRLAAHAGAGPRTIADSFPSGHSTIAMAVGLGFLLLAPRRLRLAVGLAGALYATAMGTSLVVLHSHYPSDVVGGYLVAAIWSLIAIEALRYVRGRRRRLSATTERGAPAPFTAGTMAVALLVLFTAGLGLALAFGTHHQLRAELVLHRQLVAVGVALGAVALCLVGVVFLLVNSTLDSDSAAAAPPVLPG